MHLRKLDTDRAQDIRCWIEFPFLLYRDCPQWVPPLMGEARKILDRRTHPFYQHSAADFFVVVSGEGVLGRIAVMENRSHNTFRGIKTAFFGFFEVVEGQDIAGELLGAACEWASERRLNTLIGPRGLIGTDGGGVLINGFEHRPALGIPYNYPYYDTFLETAEFEKDTDHLSGYLPISHQVPERIYAIAEKVKVRRGLWVKSFTSKAEMRQWVPRVAKVHAQAFAETYTFYPPSEAEMAIIAGTLIDIADPRLIKLVMKGEDVVGFIFAYHDISAALQKTGGRLWPSGWYTLLQERKRTKWVNVNGVGMLPAYQGLGGNALLYSELEKSVRTFDFEHIEVVQVNEKNNASRADMEAIGVRWYKRHRSYRREL